jgi:hypothetical protein
MEQGERRLFVWKKLTVLRLKTQPEADRAIDPARLQLSCHKRLDTVSSESMGHVRFLADCVGCLMLFFSPMSPKGHAVNRLAFLYFLSDKSLRQENGPA